MNSNKQNQSVAAKDGNLIATNSRHELPIIQQGEQSAEERRSQAMSQEQEKLLQEMLYFLKIIDVKIETVYGRMGELSAKTSEDLRALDKKLDDIKKQAGRQRRQT